MPRPAVRDMEYAIPSEEIGHLERRERAIAPPVGPELIATPVKIRYHRLLFADTDRAICEYWASCDQCSLVPQCGWCCGLSKCMPGNAGGATNFLCDTWQYQSCTCNPQCDGGECICGKCKCNETRTGDACELYLG